MLKLRGKVLLLVLAAAFAALALATLILNSLLEKEFARYLRTGQRGQVAEILDVLAGYYRTHGTWEGLADEVFLPGYLLSVEDAGGRPVLVRRPGRGMMRGMMGGPAERRPIRIGRETVGWAYFSLPPGAWPTKAEQDLHRAINAAILFAGLSALALAALMGLAFARRLIRPLDVMARAARAMAGGDLSARAAVEDRDEIGILAGALNDLAGRVQSLLEERRRLAADLAHELRTPLTVVKSMTEAFADGVLPADQANLGRIGAEIERLQTLIERIQEAFLAGEKPPAIYGPVDLGALAERVAARFQPRGREKGIAIDLDNAQGDHVVSGDEAGLETALGNLLDNALKYSPAGGLIQIGISSDARRVLLEVTDQGIGIPPEQLPHVFDRLYRADPSRSRETGGYGLGLAIAKEIVTAHGGELTARSDAGKGATFTIALPVKPDG